MKNIYELIYKKDNPLFLPKLQESVMRRLIQELVLDFTTSESENWKSSEVVDFLLDKLHE